MYEGKAKAAVELGNSTKVLLMPIDVCCGNAKGMAMTEIEELRLEIAELKATQADFQKSLEEMEIRLGWRERPPSKWTPPMNPLDRLSVPKEVLERMARAVPGGLKGL
jgi:hypothetical protein